MQIEPKNKNKRKTTFNLKISEKKAYKLGHI